MSTIGLKMIRSIKRKQAKTSPAIEKIERESLRRYREEQKIIKHELVGINRELFDVVRTLKGLRGNYTELRLFNKEIKKNKELILFAEKYGLNRGNYFNYLSVLIGKFIFKKVSLKTMQTKVKNWARILLQEKFIEDERKSTDLPVEFYEFLPSSASIELDLAGNLKGVVEHFATQKKTIKTKMAILTEMVENWNSIIKKVEMDYYGGNSKKKILALMTMVMMNTGIRPGEKIGRTKIKDDDGRLIEVETFGVTTLKRSHLKMIRNEVDGVESAKFEFIGKKGTLNIAEISDKNLVEMLSELMSKDNSNGNLFVTNDGEVLDYYDLSRYVDELGYNTTDFRKYVASITMFETLKKESKQMYVKLKKIAKHESVEQSKEAIQIITDTIRTAGLTVAKKLNHDDKVKAKVAIESYCSPTIVLRFLSSGGILRDIKSAIDLGNNLLVKFNLQSFFNQAEMVQAGTSVKTEQIVKETKGIAELLSDFKEIYNLIKV